MEALGGKIVIYAGNVRKASDEAKALIDEQIRDHGKITNIINKSLDVELDDNLVPYTKK